MTHPVMTTPLPVVSVVIPLYQKVRHIAVALSVAYRSCRLARAAFELAVEYPPEYLLCLPTRPSPPVRSAGLLPRLPPDFLVGSTAGDVR